MASLRLEECGRVLISTDHRLYALDCTHCDELHTQWESFLAHIKIKHKPPSLPAPLPQEQEQQQHEKAGDPTTTESVLEHTNVKERRASAEGCATSIANDTTVDSTVVETEYAYAVEEFNADNDDCNDDAISIEYLEEEQEEERESGADWAEESVDLTDYNSENDSQATVLNTPSAMEQPSTALQHSAHVPLSFDTSTVQEIELFIAQLEQHKCLWHREYIQLRNQRTHQESLESLSAATNMSVTAVTESVNYLLRWFAKSHQSPGIRNEKYYKRCSFLSDSLNKTTAKTRPQCNLSPKANAEQALQCIHCDKRFLKRKYLEVHLRRHTKEFTHKCDLCNKLTATSSDLRTHMRVHTGEKPYACAICEKTFKTSSVLCQHQRKHQQPSHQCTLCPKAYHSSYQLKNHMNAHLNQRTHKCSYCEKAFTSAKLLYAHKVNLHSELRSSYCKLCRKCIPHIKYHMKQQHAESGVNQQNDG